MPDPRLAILGRHNDWICSNRLFATHSTNHSAHDGRKTDLVTGSGRGQRRKALGCEPGPGRTACDDCRRRARGWLSPDRPRMESAFRKVLLHTARLFVPKPRAGKVDMLGRSVIVTGASRGSIGCETAKVLASWGGNVAVTCPDDSDALQAALRRHMRRIRVDPERVSARRMDLCDTRRVAEFATWYVERNNGKLHVLINNAGSHLDLLARHKKPLLSADGFEIRRAQGFVDAAADHLVRAHCQAGLQRCRRSVETARGSPLRRGVRRRDAFRSGLETPVQPQVLVGMLANLSFDQLVETGCIGFVVPCGVVLDTLQVE